MNIKAIRSRAFQGCSALKKVYISSSFFEIDNETHEPVGILEEKAFDSCNSNLEFYLVGDTDDVNTWRLLSRNTNWNQKNAYSNPGEQNAPDTSSANRYTYHISAAGASYTNDWIFTINQSNEVEISSYIGPTEIEGNAVEFLSIPDELPSGSGNKVRYITTTAFDSVKASLKRIYLPKTLKRIEAGMFGSGYTNLIVIDDNTGSKCLSDSATQSPTARIILNGLTELQAIGNNAFVDLPNLATITQLYLPYSLKAVGKRAFGTSETNGKHMKGVKDFRWDYDDTNSALKAIGSEAFYELGNNSNSKTFTSANVHQDHLSKTGAENYQLTTLVIPRTFEHFGITTTDNNNYVLGGAEDNNASFGISAFAGCPLLSKVVFKGSNTANKTANLVIASQTFAMNQSLRTVVFEERKDKNIVFHTAGSYKPAIGWSAGKSSNDFNGDPALQTLVLPNKNTNLRFQNFALQGNSRGVIYLTAGNTNRIYGMVSSTTCSQAISSPAKNDYVCQITDDEVKEWRTIGDEGTYSNVVPGYNFGSTQNTFGIDQKMPIYENVIYQDTISVPGISVSVEVGTGNTNKYVVKDKCAFICNGSTAKMTKYLYDRYDDSFSGTAKVPSKVTDANCPVNEIGASAFSAAYCDSNSYKNDNLHKDLTAVLLPDSIATIGEYAFMRAYGINKVSSYNVSTDVSNGDYVMPSSLTYIDKHAFAFCNVEKFLNIPNTCVFYENNNDTIYETSVFSNNFALNTITFGNGSTSSDYYTTTTYTHSGSSDVYTSALYSKSSVEKNKSCLLLVLNRANSDKHSASSDLADQTKIENNETVHYGELNGQYNSVHYIYGAFKMCYWVDSLIVGTPISAIESLNQPLISGIKTKVYLNVANDFASTTCDLTTVSFGVSSTIATPPYSFAGCENLTKIKLPRDPGATIPAGLFALTAGDSSVVFEVPSDDSGSPSAFKTCAPGVLDLTHTGYSGIAAEAFKDTNINKVIAPITTTFTIDVDAFGGCQNLTLFDVSNVTGTVTFNGSFRSANIPSNLFDFGSSALIEFGDETFKECTFPGKSFNFPTNTAEIGTSCFEGCSTLETVTASAVLTHLKSIVVDSGTGQNNADKPSGFKQIGDYAFYKCTNLKSFDFSKFEGIERIGHYAFSMTKPNDAGLLNPEVAGYSNNACICTDGIVDLPESITNLGVGVFSNSSIVDVTINSHSMKFERGHSFTSSPRAQINKGGSQFRSCSKLKVVYFSDRDCEWKTEYIAKLSGLNGGQDNYFSQCSSMERIFLPTDYILKYFKDENNANLRPDSMVWGSKSSLRFYLHHTLHDINNNANYPSGNICRYWHNTGSIYTNLVFYVRNSLDVVHLVNGSYTYMPAADDTEFWAVVDGEIVFLGKIKKVNGSYVIDSATGEVTFAGGYKATTTGVYKIS